MLLALAAGAVRPVRLPPARGATMSEPSSSISIREVLDENADDVAAYQALLDGGGRTLTGLASTERRDQKQRSLSARWGTAADVAILIATLPRRAEIVGTVELIGPLAAAAESGLPRRCLLQDVWVAEARRRQGVGRRLVEAAEAAAAARGVGFVSLCVVGTNEAALALYNSMGYEEVEARLRWLPCWARGDIILGKALPGGGVGDG